MPPSCFADISGKRDISQNDPSPKSSPSESHPVAHLYHSKAADGGSQIPKAKSHIPSRRRQRHERLRGKPVAKRETQQFQGILSSRVPHPHPWHDHPRSPFMFVGHSSDLLRAVPFKPRRGCRIGASQRTKVEAHTNMHFFVRSLEAREVMCPDRRCLDAARLTPKSGRPPVSPLE